MTRLAFFLFFLIVSPAQAPQTGRGKVVSIADGDTITVLHGTEQVKIRLYGIDCPEKGQPFGTKAKQRTGDLAAGKLAR